MSGLEGTRLGRYLLQNRLGRGGMSEVYLATDELMHREVAVKVVSSADSDYVERFRREAEAIGNMQHDHILPAFDVGEQAPWYYLVMPYISYCTLQEKMQEGAFPLVYAGELLAQVASALQFAHDKGIIHRDIKPSNILMRDDHYIYLADFGLAKQVEGANKVTQSGVLMGTPEYMAPELADSPATKSSDIYALGILLYRMVTGQLPFTADSSLAVFLKQMREQPAPPSRINPAIPRSVELVILRVLEKDPRRRYDTPMALANAYAQALIATQARPPLYRPPAPLPPSYETISMGQGQLRPETARSANPALPQEKLVLPALPALAPNPALAPAAQDPRRAPPDAPIPRPLPRPPQSRTPARRGESRRMGLSLFIGLIFLVCLIVVGSIGIYNLQNHQGTLPGTFQTQTATGSGSTRANPGATMTAQAQATLQAIYGEATAVTSSPPLLSDSLGSNTNNRWTDDGVACTFRNGTYHVLVSQASYLQPCPYTGAPFANCAIKVDVSLLQGNDAGFVFRENGFQFYDFEINDQGQYYFRRHDANGGNVYVRLAPSTASSAIHLGNATNTLMVIANGSDFRLFINGIFVNEVRDATYSSGVIGMVAGTIETSSNADASFANLVVYPITGQGQ